MRIRTHTNPLSCRQRFKKLNEYIDPRSFSGIDFEIGFGQEVFILNYAKQHPTRLVIGVEVRKKAVDLLKKRLEQENIHNVLVFHGSGNICIQDLFEDATIDTIFIFHPDPWLKRRHHNRRIVNQELLTIIADKLTPTGKLYLSTDVASLWTGIQQDIIDNTRLIQSHDYAFWETFYSTRWTQMCQEKNRHIFYGTFVLK
jgi:tRNA (guanine-N7-)-methyltransferase